MENGISLMVMSPERVVEKCAAQLVRLPGRKGQFTVLWNHAPLVSVLDAGDIEYETTDGEIKKISVKSGFVEIESNKVSVCVEL